jgi:xylulokinase
MAATGAELRRLVAVGGGTTGALWTQIVSDELHRRKDLPRRTIGAAYGDAFLAAVGTGATKPRDIDSWNPVARTIEPNPGRAADYDQLYQLCLDLYPATRVTAHALPARQR